MPSLSAVESQLWGRAKGSAADFGFAPDCEGLVKVMMKKAALRLEAEGYLDDPDRLAVAETNVELFISEMILEAKRLGYSELHEDTLAAAMSRLCPLWPIC